MGILHKMNENANPNNSDEKVIKKKRAYKEL